MLLRHERIHMVTIPTFFVLLQREKFIFSHRKSSGRNLQGASAGGAADAVITAGIGCSSEGFGVFVAGVACCVADAATSA